MLTIFTTPKAFKGQFTYIQENAVANWGKIIPGCEIIFFGNEYGTASIAKKYHIKHVKNVKTNGVGTPLVSDMFQQAASLSKNPYLMYANCDIIFLEDPRKFLKKIKTTRFIISGQRWDLNIKKSISLKKGWQEQLENRIKKEGKLHQVGGMDYFIFPKSVNFKMPPFAVGRGVWDNWLIYKAKFLRIPVIDATGVLPIVHQHHDYSHAGGYSAVWFGKEHGQNLKLAKEKRRPFNLTNANFVLTKTGLIKPKLSIYRLWRNFQVLPSINSEARILWPLVNFVEFLVKVKQKTNR